MYTSTFIFRSTGYDDEFHTRNDEIAERARAIPGFLGEEEWGNDRTGLHSEVYYWESLDALHQLIGMDAHRDAKGRRERWIDSYRVVIAEVLSTYGDDDLGLEHTPDAGCRGSEESQSPAS
ncbi:antibiotic biosynthesis monooxygenase family protein [Microbacterium sp. ZW T5_45]|uniref:antibiotic biosynthesis monooxygenase family protein n=1 Tax=Microbacterium sp. ZW T5_45 TaxID=3378080 RepID=UPI0038522707